MPKAHRIDAAIVRPDNQLEGGCIRSNMNKTSLSLLARRRCSPESESWDRLFKLYAPLLRVWLRKPHFAPTTWTAFCRVALDGARPNMVAQELGISLNAVCIAKSRVLSRLRQESEGLVESSSGFLAKS